MFVKLSVALCTYNGAVFLREQLESLAEQTRLPDELVIGDDRSSDETVNIIKEFAAHSPFPVKLQVNQTNLGSTKHFEQTILRCTGDIIFLSDQDDVWLPSKLEKIADVFAKSSETGMVFTDAELVDEKLNSLDRRLWQSTFPPHEQQLAAEKGFWRVLLRHNVVTGATMAFRADFRELFAPIPTHLPNMIHDGWISLVIVLHAEVKFLNEPLIKYRQHSAQQLGIGWESERAKNSFSKGWNRTASYAKSIAYYQGEEKRLRQMSEVFRTLPLFIKAKRRLSEDVDKIIEAETERVREIIKHYAARKDLSPNRLRRVNAIFREALSGRYHRFSSGFTSIARDLIEVWQH